MYVYVGSRTTRERHARGRGITVFRFDPATARLDRIQECTGLVNPSFLVMNRAGTHLYTVHGDREEVSAFGIGVDGRIEHLGSQSTQGRNPVHLALDPTERFLVVSNHLTSSLAVLPVAPGGEIEPVVQLLALEGKVGPHRLEQPHSKPHFNPFDPSGRFVLVPDKGLDTVFSFEFVDGRLRPAAPRAVTCREHSGPRNLVFHPSLDVAYVVNELDSTVTQYCFDPAHGSLQPAQIIPTLAQDFTGNNRAAGIAIHPSGRFLYASNRGADTIALFAVDPATGWLTAAGMQPTLGRTPRFITLSPEGRFLFAANEDSDSVVLFLVDSITGALAPTGPSIPIGSPVSMVFRMA